MSPFLRAHLVVQGVAVTRVAATLLLVLAFPRPVAADARRLEPALVREPTARPRLELDRPWGAALAGTALAAWELSALEQREVDLHACRWCEPGRFDLAARGALRWRDTRAAGDASDALLLVVPLGSALAVAWLAARDGERNEIVDDVLAVALAVAINAPVTTAVKHGAGRLRPAPWAAGGAREEGDLHGFYSGHASRVSAAAFAAAQVARLRGRTGWRWLAAAALVASAGTAYLRVAADQHWTTDALAGAAAGAAVGLAVPPLLLRRTGAARAPVASIAPAPGGLAIVF